MIKDLSGKEVKEGDGGYFPVGFASATVAFLTKIETGVGANIAVDAKGQVAPAQPMAYFTVAIPIRADGLVPFIKVQDAPTSD